MSWDDFYLNPIKKGEKSCKDDDDNNGDEGDDGIKRPSMDYLLMDLAKSYEDNNASFHAYLLIYQKKQE